MAATGRPRGRQRGVWIVKFKVGDQVRSKVTVGKVTAGECGAITEVGSDGWPFVHFERAGKGISMQIADLVPSEFVTHDSGERIDYPSGMRRDTTKGKLRYDLIPLFFLKRLAGLYTRGAEKYGDNNWRLAN